MYNNEKKYGLKYAILFDVLIPRSVHELVVLWCSEKGDYSLDLRPDRNPDC